MRNRLRTHKRQIAKMLLNRATDDPATHSKGIRTEVRTNSLWRTNMYESHQRNGSKRAYVAPRLVEYGSVTELTQAPPAFAFLAGSISGSATATGT
jgi:hypothetical protein